MRQRAIGKDTSSHPHQGRIFEVAEKQKQMAGWRRRLRVERQFAGIEGDMSND